MTGQTGQIRKTKGQEKETDQAGWQRERQGDNKCCQLQHRWTIGVLVYPTMHTNAQPKWRVIHFVYLLFESCWQHCCPHIIHYERTREWSWHEKKALCHATLTKGLPHMCAVYWLRSLGWKITSPCKSKLGFVVLSLFLGVIADAITVNCLCFK